jgi:hypothetical protein
MSIHNHDLSLDNEQKGSSGTDKRPWERPTLRRLAANKAEHGHGHKADEGAHVAHRCS